ncbi:MAG TPA: NTP transferase domain-containing protein, partial [Burkholderiaceae bacterium]|nr:NTP transferase domain-containing protein [Burkholderiaceae bacterium]
MSFVLVIPARAASTRLPNKPLLDVVGLPLVVRTAQQVARAGAAQLLVATDDETIATVVEKHGFSAMLTDATHDSGTDRLSEVVERLSLADETIVVNVQGDEPLIDPEIVKLLADQLSDSSQAAIA